MAVLGSRGACHETKGTVEGVENMMLLANLAATAVMCGVIWFVQVVHYPLLSIVPVEAASSTAVEHQRRTAWVVGAPMAIEGVTTLALLLATPDGVAAWLPWAGGVLLAVALGSTVLLSVPRHERMATAPDARVGRELVLTNWPRTVAWTSRVVLCSVMAAQAWW